MVITDLYRIFGFLPVFDMFEIEIGSVRIIMESQSGERPNEHMKMSSAPSFGGAPGGHIFDVVALVSEG